VSAAKPSAHPPPGRELAAVLGVIAIGGAIGSLLRYQATLIWPNPVGTFPSTVLLVNVAGCLVIGAFMVIITELRTTHHLIRPFVGTGVLGGFTTFSTYSLDILQLVRTGHPGQAIGYLSFTAVGAMVAVLAGMLGMRRLAIAFSWER
jgi:CrcB protein